MRRVGQRRRAKRVLGNRYTGDGRDYGKYYRCKICNTAVNAERDALGGPESGDGLAFKDTVTLSVPTLGDELSSLALQESSVLAMAVGADSLSKGIRHDIEDNGGTGCPFCHSLNWK